MNDHNTNLQELKERVKLFTQQRDWNQYHNPKNLSMSIGIEAAELMEIFQWITIEDSINMESHQEFIHINEELSDVILYCLSMANQLNIDIAESIENKMIKNSQKYPIKDSKVSGENNVKV